MTQDCLNSPSTADVSKHLPKGIHVTGADDKSDPAIEGMSWSHLFFTTRQPRLWLVIAKLCRDFEKILQPCFIQK